MRIPVMDIWYLYSFKSDFHVLSGCVCLFYWPGMFLVLEKGLGVDDFSRHHGSIPWNWGGRQYRQRGRIVEVQAGDSTVEIFFQVGTLNSVHCLWELSRICVCFTTSLVKYPKPVLEIVRVHVQNSVRVSRVIIRIIKFRKYWVTLSYNCV